MLMLVPFTYVLLTVFQIQRAAYGITQAARDAGRAFATAASSVEGQRQADATVALAMRDQGIARGGVNVRVLCSARPCLTPGAAVTVTIEDRVALPWVPALLGRPAASITVRAVHVQTVDAFRPTRP
jgi:hypothetical protein